MARFSPSSFIAAALLFVVAPVAKASAAGFRIVEVPITLSMRRHGTSYMFYRPALFTRYDYLLMKCRGLMRDVRA